MPRKQRIVANTSGTGVLDAFAVTKDQVPTAFHDKPVIIAPQNDIHEQREKDDKTTEVFSELYTPKPKIGKTKASAQLVEQPPIINRIGRRKTGRNIQFNQSVTAETANAFYEMQSKLNIPMGAVLERAIEALQAAEKGRRAERDNIA